MNQDVVVAEKCMERDFFICDVADAVIKDISSHMEHPFFSLSKKRDMVPRRYENGDNWLELQPSYLGLATIYDKDILIYAISQLVAAKRKNRPTSPTIRINCRQFFLFVKWGVSGRDYKRFCAAIDRLSGTRIRTNVKNGDTETYSNFALINEGSIRRKNGQDGRLLWVEIGLSRWLYDAVERYEILTLHKDYFRLRQPIERRIYELARKHCGHQPDWKIGLDLLKKKSGSLASLEKFRFTIRRIQKKQQLPDYLIKLDGGTDRVTITNREGWSHKRTFNTKIHPLLKYSNTYSRAALVIPGDDQVEDWEKKWVEHWVDSGCPELTNPDEAFVAFCRRQTDAVSGKKTQLGEGSHDV